MSNDNDFESLKLKVEAILFSYGDWISLHDILDTLGMDSELMITNSLKELQDKYKSGHSFSIEQNDGGKWRMALTDEYSEIVTELISGTEIPKSVLKVLSVIAYEQPVTKTRLSEILGKSVKSEVEYLYKAKFLSYEKHGVGKYYKVTKKFYDYFKIDEGGDFRSEANKNINTYLIEPEQIVEDLEKDENSESEKIN